MTWFKRQHLRQKLAWASVFMTVFMGLGVVTGAHAQAPKKSGYDFMSPQLQAMQNDEANNPGMLWVRQGQSLWHSSQATENPPPCVVWPRATRRFLKLCKSPSTWRNASTNAANAKVHLLSSMRAKNC